MSGEREAGEGLGMLIRFIAESFERHELKMLVLELQNGKELLTELPGDIASPAKTASAFVAAVEMRGLLDADFFATLLKHRSRLSPEINEIRQKCLAAAEKAGVLGPGVLLRGGRYRIEELIGHGGVGSIWLAHDRNSRAPVAIKMLRRDMRDYKIRRWQFIKGANQMAAISHACVARVIEPHFSELGHDFCVLQYVQGRSLADAVRNRQLTDLQSIIGVILDVGMGLAALHPRLFHGDVSPKNIILGPDGHATLVDFDLAGETDDVPMTRATGNAGTDPFASPEWRRRSDMIDARTDIFSLGMTLLYALYGDVLPGGLNDHRVGGPGPFIEKHLDCDAAIKAVLHRACAIDLTERTRTIYEFCRTLREAVRPLLRSGPALEVSEVPSIAPPEEHGPTPARETRTRQGPAEQRPVMVPPPDRVATATPDEPLPEQLLAVAPLPERDADPVPPKPLIVEQVVTGVPPGLARQDLQKPALEPAPPEYQVVDPSPVESVPKLSSVSVAVARPHDSPNPAVEREPRLQRFLPYFLVLLALGSGALVWQLSTTVPPPSDINTPSNDPPISIGSSPEDVAPRTENPGSPGDIDTSSATTTVDASSTGSPGSEILLEPIGPVRPPPPPPPRKRIRTLDDARMDLEKRAKPLGRACREQEYGPSEQDTPGNTDEVTLSILLSADGRVLSATPSDGDVGINLAKCLAGAIRRERLRPFEGPADPFTHTFLF